MTTPPFVYRPRSRASVEHVRRLHQRAEAIRRAYHGQTKTLCDLLRAAGQNDIADLIRDAKGFRKRGAPRPTKRSEIKQYILDLVRRDDGGVTGLGL
jgi:hypothetical protein